MVSELACRDTEKKDLAVLGENPVQGDGGDGGVHHGPGDHGGEEAGLEAVDGGLELLGPVPFGEAVKVEGPEFIDRGIVDMGQEGIPEGLIKEEAVGLSKGAVIRDEGPKGAVQVGFKPGGILGLVKETLEEGDDAAYLAVNVGPLSGCEGSGVFKKVKPEGAVWPLFKKGYALSFLGRCQGDDAVGEVTMGIDEDG